MLSKSVNNDATADEALAAITAFIAECNDDVIGTGREWKCGVCSKQVSLAIARTGCWPELQARRWLQGQITNHCKSGGHNQAKQQSLAPAKNTTLLGLWGRAAPPSGTSASGAGASAGGPGLASAPQPQCRRRRRRSNRQARAWKPRRKLRRYLPSQHSCRGLSRT
jgi:hypothetical protein